MTRAEFSRLIRFGIVGATVAALYMVLYLALLPLMAQPTANATAFAVAVVVQYVGQTVFTFRRQLAIPDQIGRFAATIAAGLVVSALLTGWIGPGLGLADWISAAAVMVLLPVQNFIFMRLWVYRAGKVAV